MPGLFQRDQGKAQEEQNAETQAIIIEWVPLWKEHWAGIRKAVCFPWLSLDHPASHHQHCSTAVKNLGSDGRARVLAMLLLFSLGFCKCE